ncbi:hypothetical protein PSYJYH_000005 [Bacillus phage PSYJ-YH]|nr:hypothetical protein PSYJYH_000005 [Bacillus phage PSYJ-YH]
MNRKDYMKKRDRIIDDWNTCKISLGERNAQLVILSRHFRHVWGNQITLQNGVAC